MICDPLHFDPRAKREWDALDGSIKAQLRKVLLFNDLKSRMSSRLVYRVDDGKILILVIAMGRRDREAIYRNAAERS